MIGSTCWRQLLCIAPLRDAPRSICHGVEIEMRFSSATRSYTAERRLASATLPLQVPEPVCTWHCLVGSVRNTPSRDEVDGRVMLRTVTRTERLPTTLAP